YAKEVPKADPFFIGWDEFQEQAGTKGMAIIKLAEVESNIISTVDAESQPATDAAFPLSETPHTPFPTPHFDGLDAFRPLTERAPEPQVAEAQRREFFAQLHRWSRQDYAVHVFCNNDGERQRFAEVWEEYALGKETPTLHIGALARGFLYDEGKLVVI